jgi:hypothetical protein
MSLPDSDAALANDVKPVKEREFSAQASQEKGRFATSISIFLGRPHDRRRSGRV